MWPFESKLSRDRKERQNEFNNLLELAHDVANQNPAGLINLVRMYMQPMQTGLLLSCAVKELHGAGAEMMPAHLFMPSARLDLTDHWRYPKLDVQEFEVNLAKDPVLPCPWHRERLSSALATIGTGKKSGAWEQDSNHSVAVIMPWGIACVLGGNHSITAGILQGEGVVEPVEAWDMSALLEKVHCDGVHYVDSQSGQPICEMLNPYMGAVFEIGRLMKKHHIKPLRKEIQMA